MWSSVRTHHLDLQGLADNFCAGQLVGNFTSYFTPGTNMTRSEFQAEINKLALFIVYLFIAKFVLTYLSMVSCVRMI